MNNNWWSEWLITLIISSGILLIFKQGIWVSILLWLIYVLDGREIVKKSPKKENIQQYHKRIISAIVVIVVSAILLITASCN